MPPVFRVIHGISSGCGPRWDVRSDCTSTWSVGCDCALPPRREASSAGPASAAAADASRRKVFLSFFLCRSGGQNTFHWINTCSFTCRRVEHPWSLRARLPCSVRLLALSCWGSRPLVDGGGYVCHMWSPHFSQLEWGLYLPVSIFFYFTHK